MTSRLMFSVKRLLGREEKFHDLLERSADEARIGANLLVTILGHEGPTQAPSIHGATTLGPPVSTTHVSSASIMGVGAMKRFGAVNWGVVERIVWAWIFTLPVAALIGRWALKLRRLAGLG